MTAVDHEHCAEAGTCWQDREVCPEGASKPSGGLPAANLGETLGEERRSLRRANSIPQHLQTQESLTAQLQALRVAANRLGLYDAADWLGKMDV